MSGPAAPSPTARADIAARVRGATAGVARDGGQTVFESSTAPRSAADKSSGKGKGKRSAAAKSGGPTASERSATADIWTGVSSQGRSPSLASAAAMDARGGGLSGLAVAAMAILGLGLAGLAGAALATGRRRQAARATGESNHQ